MALIDDIKTIASDFDEDFIQAVLNRLESFGYEVKNDDAWVIAFSIQKVDNTIKNECYTSKIPDGLFHVAVDMVCGQFLLGKKQTGQLEIGDLDLTGAVSSIKEGDTQVNFTGASDDEKVTNFIAYLVEGGKGELVCYRKMRW